MAHRHRCGIAVLLGVCLQLTPGALFAQSAGKALLVENDAERFRLASGRWRPLGQGGNFAFQDDLRTLADSRLLLVLQKTEFLLSPQTTVTIGGSRGQPELLVQGGIARVEVKSGGRGVPVIPVKSSSGHEAKARTTSFVVSCPSPEDVRRLSAGTRCGDRVAAAGECVFVGLFGEAEVSLPGGTPVELGLQECTVVQKGRDPPPPVEMALTDFEELVRVTALPGIVATPLHEDCESPNCRPPVDDVLLPLPLPPPLPPLPPPPGRPGEEEP